MSSTPIPVDPGAADEPEGEQPRIYFAVIKDTTGNYADSNWYRPGDRCFGCPGPCTNPHGHAQAKVDEWNGLFGPHHIVVGVDAATVDEGRITVRRMLAARYRAAAGVRNPVHLVKEWRLITADRWRTPMGDTQDRAVAARWATALRAGRPVTFTDEATGREIPFGEPVRMRVLWFQYRPELDAQS